VSKNKGETFKLLEVESQRKKSNAWFLSFRTTIDIPACIHPIQITKETKLICILMIGTYDMNSASQCHENDLFFVNMQKIKQKPLYLTKNAHSLP
jgi:hypothetical protein